MLAVVLILSGAGCLTTTNTANSTVNTSSAADVDLDALCDVTTGAVSTTTPHGSTTCGGADPALIGTWKLQSQTVVGTNLRLEEGKTLRFTANKVYWEDYSSEKLEKVSVNTPDGPASEQCKASGTSSGPYYVSFETDDSGNAAMFLESGKDANLDADGIKVTCDEGPSGMPVVSTSPSQSLGVGKITGGQCNIDPSGPCVKYGYTITNNGNTLTITSIDGPAMTQVYERI